MIAKIVKLFAAAALMIGLSTAWAQPGIHQGEILETMNSAGYTYAQVKKDDETYWIAGPQTDVVKGDTVEYSEQMWMNGFTSKTLNRSFEKLMFVGKIIKK